MIEAFTVRVEAAIAAMLVRASDASFGEEESVSLVLVTVIFESRRTAFELNLSATAGHGVRAEPLMMFRLYLQTVKPSGVP